MPLLLTYFLSQSNNTLSVRLGFYFCHFGSLKWHGYLHSANIVDILLWCSDVVVSIYLIGRVQKRGQKVTIYGDMDVPFRSQYHSIDDEPFF